MQDVQIKNRELKSAKERLVPMFERQVSVTSISLVPAVLIYFYFKESNGALQMLWFNITGFFVLARLGLSLWYLNKSGGWLDCKDHIKFEKFYAVVIAVTAFFWGTAMYAFFPIAKNNEILIPVLFPLGILVSGVLNLGNSKINAVSFLAAIMLGYASYFIYDWTTLSPLMLLACVTFGISLLKGSFQAFNDFVKLQNMINEKEILLSQAQDRIQLEEELVHQKMISAQTAKLASLGEMAGGIAHEINNPLAIIKMKADSLSKYYEKQKLELEQADKGFKTISQTVDRIGKIIEGLLLFSRDHTQVEKEDYSAVNLIEEALDLTEEKFRSKNITVIKKFPEEDLVVNVNRIALSQVIINLINNSYYFIKNSENPWIEIELSKLNEAAIFISITDSGKPIDEEIANKIFDPFFSGKPVGEGTGLGLSITKGILHEHDGDIQLKKCEHPCFILTLPLKNTTKMAA